MRLTKSDASAYQTELTVQPERFSPPVLVQGGKRRACENKILVESGGRHKLFCEGRELIYFLEGSGHFKWARGETPFCAGELFEAEKINEYEINGKCVFLVVRM